MTMYTRAWPMPPRNGTTIYHLTDTHVGYSDPYGGWDDAKRLGVIRDVESAFTRHVDGLVHTGDITDDGGDTGQDEATQDSRALTFLNRLYPNLPSVWTPGNHDLWDRTGQTGPNQPYSSAAWEWTYGRPANGTTDMGDVRIIHFSPEIHEFHTHWDITASRLEWINQQAQASPKPVILANHFPLIELNQKFGYGTSDLGHLYPVAEFDDLIGSNPNIVGMLSGHKHYQASDVRSAEVLTVGGRNLIHICGPSQALTGPPEISGYADAAKIPQRSLYITVLEPDRWDIRVRTHTPRRWETVDGWRVTTINRATGEETHSMGGSA